MQKKKTNFEKDDGLNYLIPLWKEFAEKYVETETYIYEWLNDIDARRLIDELLAELSEKERTKVEKVVKKIDKEVIAKTFEIEECVWGEKVENDNQYDRKKNWYYYRVNQKVFDSEDGRFTKRKVA